MTLVKELSTDDSPDYVNGVLGAILRDSQDLLADISTRTVEDAGH